MKYFISLRTITEKAPFIWKRYYTVGKLELKEFNPKEKKNCFYSFRFLSPSSPLPSPQGLFAAAVKMILGQLARIEEKKCPSRGDSYHLFEIRW